MNEEAQKRILSYFIEEARDHLATIEQVLLSLRDSINDPELINELFRAAHSIKGGSAMLGLTSIQRTAHRMEDFFNVFRSHPGRVPVDQHLETLLLRAFDGLSLLLEELQSPRGLTEEVSKATLAELEPVFQETEKHIQALLGEGPPPAAPTPPPVTRTLQRDMAEVVPQQLRQMLELFKQREQPDVRERLLAANAVLKEIGEFHRVAGWQRLTETVEQALSNPDTDLRTLALVALRDLKQGQQLLLAGKVEQVAPSAELQQLAQPPAPPPPPDPLEVVVHQQIPTLLRQMLELFKRPADPATRPGLQALAQSLQELGQSESPPLELGGWPALTQLIGEILADPSQDLRQLALPVLRDLKQAHQALASGAAHTIQPSAELLAFRPVPSVSEATVPELFQLEEPLPAAPDSVAVDEAEEGAAAGIPAEEGSWEPEPVAEVADLATAGSLQEETSGAGLWPEPEMPAEAPVQEDWAATFAGETAAALEESPEAEIGLPQDMLGANLASDSGDFEATPLELEEEASSAFDELFANAEELSDIEEPLPELIPISSEAFEELSPRLEEEEVAADLAELFAEVVGETTAEPVSAELTWTEAAGESIWEEVRLEADQELAAEDAAETPEMSGGVPPAEEGTSSGLEALFEIEELPAESSPLPAELELSNFGATLDGEPETTVEVADLQQTTEAGETQVDLWAEFSAAIQAEDFSDNFSDTAEHSADAPASPMEMDLMDLSMADTAQDSLESLFLSPESPEIEELEANQPWFVPEAAEVAPSSETSVEAGEPDLAGVEQLEDLFAEEPFSTLDTLDELALTPDSSGELVGSELSLADLFASQDLEETPAPAAELQPTDLGDRVFSPEVSFDRLDALFGQEADTEGLHLQASEYPSAMDVDGDGQVDLDELSRFFAETEGTQEDFLSGFAISPDDAETGQESGLPEETELPVAAEEESPENDLESQLASLFADDDFLAGPSLTVPVGEAEHSDAEELEAPAAPCLEDLAALFDAVEPAAPSEEDILSIAEPASAAAAPSGAGGDFEAQLESLLEDLNVAPSIPAAAPAPAPAPPAVADAAAPAVTAPSARRTSALSNPVMRVEVRHLDSINNLVGELVIIRNSMEQNQTRLRQFLDGLLGRVQQLGDLGQRMRDQYDRSLLEAALFSSRSGTATVSFSRNGEGAPRGRMGHSSGQEFDKLEMDQFTAFHALAQEIIELIVRVRESSSDIEFAVDEAEQITRQFRQVTTQLQEGLNRARMVPFSQIADRLPRAVRDLSLKTGKQASLVVEGRETLIDKAILEELSAPMTHLVNNALVHGIEPPEERRRLGKSPEGKITVKAFYQGNQTIIAVSDDGAGINVEKVKAKAQRLGLLSEQADEDEVFDVLFNPGFTVREADEVDDLAGRGVGLDVVRSKITEMRGSVQVDSTRGKGTTFTIRLPLTLSISKAMVCVSDKALIAFPLDGVEEMLDVPADEVRPDEQGRPSIPWRDQRLPFQPLSNLLSYSRSHNRSRSEVYGIAQDEGIIPIVVLQSAGQYVALQVDSFVEEQEIVIKQLRGPVPKPAGISGVTVLGNGRVLPIADVIELVDMAYGRRRDLSRFWSHRAEEPVAEEVHQTTVLIVDDSITVRELLSMSFQKVGYRVEQARDGQDAWEKLRGGLPCDLIFCDIEMPRMDGLELLARLRQDSNFSHIPVAMLTSRGAERHRQTARELGATAYFTKPYLEEELLSAAARMLQGEHLLAPSPAS